MYILTGIHNGRFFQNDQEKYWVYYLKIAFLKQHLQMTEEFLIILPLKKRSSYCLNQ